MSGPYDLVEVIVMGPTKPEVCYARPFEWNKEPWTQDGRDRSGKWLIPLKYMMTCPKCAGRLDFTPDDIAEDKTVICNLCDPHAAQMQRIRNIKAREGKESEETKEKTKTEIADSPKVAKEMKKLEEQMSCKCGKTCSRSQEKDLEKAGITQEDLKKYGVTLVPETETTDTTSKAPDVVVNFSEKKLRDPLTPDYDKSNLA